MDGPAAVGDAVFFFGGERGVDLCEAVGDETGREGNAVRDGGLRCGEEGARASAFEDVDDVVVWKFEGGGADEGGAVKFVRVFLEFCEEVREPLFVRGVFAGTPATSFDAELVWEGGNFDTGVFGDGCDVVRFIVIKIAFYFCVFFVGCSGFLRIFGYM